LIFGLLIAQVSRSLKNITEIPKGAWYKSTSVILIVYSKILYIPMLDIIINNAIVAQRRTSEPENIAYLVFSIYSIFVYSGLQFYAKRLLKLNIKSGDNLGSWSEPTSKIIYMEFLVKIIIPIILAFDPESVFI